MIINVAPRWRMVDRHRRIVDDGGAREDGGDDASSSPPTTTSFPSSSPNSSIVLNSSTEERWLYDVTPITLAAMRGHDGIVEYLLREGADPTLSGCPRYDVVVLPSHAGWTEDDDDDEVEDHRRDDDDINRRDLRMDAFVAASKLSRKIRRCRRTQDLLMAVKVRTRGERRGGGGAGQEGVRRVHVPFFV
jgi:hypothetical protein